MKCMSLFYVNPSRLGDVPLGLEIFLGLENGETEKYLISGQLYRKVEKGDQIRVRVRNGWIIRLEPTA